MHRGCRSWGPMGSGTPHCASGLLIMQQLRLTAVHSASLDRGKTSILENSVFDQRNELEARSSIDFKDHAAIDELLQFSSCLPNACRAGRYQHKRDQAPTG